MGTSTLSRAVKIRRLSRAQRTEVDMFRAIILVALGSRARVVVDAEGWPLVPGRLGRLEWRGIEVGAGPDRPSARLYAFTDRPRLIAWLCAIPGVRRAQIGDQEAAVSMAAEDMPTIQAAAGLLRTRIRRSPESTRNRFKAPSRATSAGEKAPIPPGGAR